jgi:protein phosphatase
VELTIIGKTDIGSMREENQDALGDLKLDGGAFLAVADGMGGYAGGSLAARLAIDKLLEHVEEHWKKQDCQPREILRDAVQAANKAVREKALSNEELQDMGTTCVCALVCEDKYYLAHVGDSRAYLFRQGRLTLLTEDHTVIQQLIKKGKVGPLEASYHPSAGILMRCLGQLEEVEPDLAGPEELQPGDRLMLCSDGLTGMVYEDEIAQVMTQKEMEPAGDTLIQMANEAGGFDNITVGILQAGVFPEDAGDWDLIVDSPEGLALLAAEGRLPPDIDQKTLRHTVVMPAVGGEVAEPTLPSVAHQEEWKPGRDRLKVLLLVGGVLILLAAGGLYFLLD